MTDRFARIVPLVLFAVITLSLAQSPAAEISLPERAPVPMPRPETHASKSASAPAVVAAIPILTPRPPPPAPASPQSRPPAPPPIEGQPLAAAETACRAALRRLGAAFKDRPAESEPGGCVISHPVEITSLSPAVALQPEALLKCAMAETAARFVKQVVAPAARKHLGASLTAVRHASAYVCRPRNGSSKLSEHAFGNALDFSAFELQDGKVIEVGGKNGPAEQKFLDAIRKAACGPFKTVLGPGSDADHSDHFHFDLAPRRRGSTFCQ